MVKYIYVKKCSCYFDLTFQYIHETPQDGKKPKHILLDHM